MPVLAVLACALAALMLGCGLGLRMGLAWGRIGAARRLLLRRLGVKRRADSRNGALGLAADLASAVAKNQLFLVHQPKMHTRSGAVAAVETLVRWQHPTRGLIGPNDFIALAEEHGLIRTITEWVVQQAIVEQRNLAACGHTLAFNVNISAHILADRSFAEWLVGVARDASGPIGLEITETAMIADPEGALRNLHLFADAGMKIAIDDYGAGLSSLAYLKQLPANELKIDRMFVSGLSSSHRDPLLVRSTIDLAHALDMEITAEGVDSPAALALLRVMGCDLAQGFLIAMPMSIADLRAFLDSRQDAPVETSPQGFSWIRSAQGSQ